MADEYTRSEYLKSLLNQKKAIVNNDSQLLNPSVQTTDDSFVTSETQQSKPENNNFWTDVVSVTDKLLTGFFGALEGVADLAGLIGIGIGDLFGADTSELRETVELKQAPHYAHALSGLMVGDFSAWEHSVWDQTSFNSTLDTKFGQFVGDIAEGVGFFLPAIITGGAAGAGATAGGASAAAASHAAQVASLATLGVSAAGQGGQEALNDGASSGQALAYGVVKGGIEVGTELVVGKALSKIPGINKIFKGLGQGAVNGVSFSSNAVKTGLATKIASTMLEEGAEEVASELLSPVAAAITYKGETALEDYGKQEYWHGVLHSFLTGAVTGGIMEGGQKATIAAKYSTSGLKLVELQGEFQNTVKLANEARMSGNQALFEQYSNRLAQIQGAMIDTIQEFKEKHPKQFNKFWAKAQYVSEQQFRGSIEKPVLDALNEALTSDLSEKLGKDFSLHIVDESSLKQVQNADGSYSYPKAFYDPSSNTVVINKAYETEFGQLFKHEVISHVILDTNPDSVNSIVKFIESKPELNEKFHQYDDELTELYGKDASLLAKERLAKFMESQLKNPADIAKAFGGSSSRISNFLRNILNKLNGLKGAKGISKVLINNIQKAISELENKTSKKEAVAYAKDKKSESKPKEKGVLGKWLQNDGKDSMSVEKIDGKYKVFNEAKKLLTEFETAQEVRDYMADAKATKYVAEKPKKLNNGFKIASNKDVFIVKNGEIITQKLVQKGDKWVVQTKGADGLITESETKPYKEARNIIETNVNKFYTRAQAQKFIDTKAERIKRNKSKSVKTIKNESKVEKTPSTYKKVSTTEDIIKTVKESFESNKSAKVQLAFPKNFESFVSKTFTQINDVKTLNAETKNVFNMLMETTLRDYDDINNEWNSVGKLKDLLSDSEKASLKNNLKSLIKKSSSEKAKSAETKPFEVTIERLSDKVSKTANKTRETRVLTNQRRLIKNEIKARFVINQQNVERNGLEFMLYPVYSMKGQTTYSQRGLLEDFNAVKKMYEEIGENPTLYPGIFYEEEISELIDDIIDSIGEPVRRSDGKLQYGNATAQTERLLNEYIRVVRNQISKIKARYVQNYAPTAKQTVRSINNSKYGLKTGRIAKLGRMYGRGFLPAYVELRSMLGGDSRLAQILTVDYQNAQNSKKLYDGSFHVALRNQLKELGIKRQFNKRLFEVNKKKLSTGQALYLYISTQVDANYQAINESGVKYIDENGRTRTLVDKGNAEALKSQIEQILPDNYKKLGKWILETMNGTIKSDYIKMYEQRMGKYNRRNEIGNVGENTYWTLLRAHDTMSSVESKMINALGLFSNAKSRTNTNKAVLLGDAMSVFTTYVDRLSTETYLKPAYRDALAVLNTKVDDNGTTVMSVLSEKLDPQDVKYLKTTMEDMVGALETKNDIFVGIMSRFSVAKLSLNIGSMMKQFASMFTSNIPMYKGAKGFFSRFSSAYRAEYKILQKELGGLAYRSGKDIVRANADSLGNITGKIAEAGMMGITAVDKFTINTGIFSLMTIAKDQFGYEIGSKENIDFVKEQWHEFELSQIGSGALSKNAIARGDYNSLAKSVFGFLQGANRAAIGSQVNKIGLWKRNHGLKQADVQNARTEARKAVEEFETKFKDKDGRVDVTKLTEEQQKEYINLQTEKIDAETKYDDFIKFKVAGGNAIPLHMAAGLIAQGVFVALINELMKRIKGKKDWDEWEIADLGKNLAFAIAVDWVPFVNSVSSMARGYDVQVPAVEVLNEVKDVLSTMTSGNFKSSARKLAILIGDSTGIPFQTIYDYIYGTVKAFDPGTAEEMKSVFYGLTAANATSTMNHHAEKKDYNKTYSMMGLVLDNYRVNSSDEVKREITSLVINGQKTLPAQYMTSYTTESGDKVDLSKEQIESFRAIYNKSDEQAKVLVSDSLYSSLTNEEKALTLKRLYSLYYNYAKYQVTGIEPSSKLGKLLALTNGNIDTAQYLLYLQELGKIKDTKKATRKKLSIKYINNIKGLSKADKLVLMYLAGYKVADNNKKAVVNRLIGLGMSQKDAEEFMK